MVLKTLVWLASTVFFCTWTYADSIKQLRLATTNFPPYYGENMPEGGPFTRITRQAFAEAGYQANIEFIPWVRAVEWGKEGKVAGIVGAWITPDRKPYFVATEAVMTNKLVFYKQRNSPIKFDTYEDIAAQDLWIGTVYGYAQPKGLSEAGVNFVYTTRDKQPFMLLSKGRVDLVIVDQDYAKVTLALPDMKPYLERVEVIDRVMEQRDLHVLLSRKVDNVDEIIKAFNQGLASLKQDGRYQQILSGALTVSSDKSN